MIIPILITGAGTTTAISVIKGLKKQSEFNLRIITVDMNPQSAGRYLSDKFYVVPSAFDMNFISRVLKICQKEKVKLLIPIVDYEFMLLSKNSYKFENIGCKIIISKPETISICNEKDKTYKFFKKNQILTPETYLPNEIKKLSSTDFPLILKPRTGRATLDTYKIENFKDLDFYSKRVKDYIIQKYVNGEEYTVDTLSDFDCKMIAAVPRRRVEIKSGVSYKGTTVKNSEMLKSAKLIVESAKIIGPANIQCIKSYGGDIYFFEINPRFSAGLPLTISAGLNSPYLLLKLFLNKKISNNLNSFKENLTMLRYWEEIFV